MKMVPALSSPIYFSEESQLYFPSPPSTRCRPQKGPGDTARLTSPSPDLELRESLPTLESKLRGYALGPAYAQEDAQRPQGNAASTASIWKCLMPRLPAKLQLFTCLSLPVAHELLKNWGSHLFYLPHINE